MKRGKVYEVLVYRSSHIKSNKIQIQKLKKNLLGQIKGSGIYSRNSLTYKRYKGLQIETDLSNFRQTHK